MSNWQRRRKNMKKLDTEILKTWLKSGWQFLLDEIRTYNKEECEQAFADAVEIGISNTVSALYDANVSEEEIGRALNKFWGINKNEADERILYEKSNAIIRELKHYLKMQGYSDQELKQLAMNTGAFSKIRHDKEMWKLKGSPEKVYKMLTKNNDIKRK